MGVKEHSNSDALGFKSDKNSDASRFNSDKQEHSLLNSKGRSESLGGFMSDSKITFGDSSSRDSHWIGDSDSVGDWREKRDERG